MEGHQPTSEIGRVGLTEVDNLRSVALSESIRTAKQEITAIRQRANACGIMSIEDRYNIAFHAGRIDMAYSVLRLMGDGE